MIARLYSRLLRWAFTRFYREFAWTYDTVAAIVSRGLWRHWIGAALPLLRGDRVLEIGSGTGYLQRALAQQGISAIGLDASPYMLRLARRKIRRAGGSDWLVQAHAQHVPFPDSSFSDVIATFPAEYILDPATLQEAWRVLRPGGQFLSIDSAMLTKRDAYTAAVDAAYHATGQVRYTDPRPDLLRQLGFDVYRGSLTVKASEVYFLRAIKRSEH